MKKEAIYINYGCGFSHTPEEWYNCDVSPTLYINENWFMRFVFFTVLRRKNIFPKNVKFGNIIKGLSKKYNGLCTGVFCSHVLEHLTLEEFRIALKNSYDLLHKDGTFRIIVPSLTYIIEEYNRMANSEEERADAASFLCRSSLLGRENHDRNKIREFFKVHFFKSYHFWMWDYFSLKAELEKIGFVNIRCANSCDSTDKMFSLIEKHDTVTHKNLYIECNK